MAEEKDIDQLIGAYIEEELNQEDKAWLERQMDQDPELAELVEGLRLEKQIETYLEKTPSIAEKEAFEKALANNERLRKAWDDYHITRGVVKLKQREQHLEWFEAIEKKQAGPSSTSGRISKWPLIGLLLTVLILILGWWCWNASDKTTEDSLTSVDSLSQTSSNTDILNPLDSVEINDANEGPEDTNNRNSDRQTDFKDPKEEDESSEVDSVKVYASSLAPQIRKYYNESGTLGSTDGRKWKEAFRDSSYETVINILSPATDSLFTNKKTEAILYLGVSYLLSDRSERCQLANTVFNRLSAESAGHRPSLLEQSNWYHILALICEGQIDQALPLLRTIVASGEHPYILEAEKLLELQNESN